MAAVCLLGPHQILHGRVVAEQVKALGGEGEAGEAAVAVGEAERGATASPAADWGSASSAHSGNHPGPGSRLA